MKGGKRFPTAAAAGSAIIMLFVLLGIFAPLIAPYGESEFIGEAWSRYHLNFGWARIT